LSGRQVVTSLPREIVQVKNLRLPMIPPHELAAAVEFEARNIFTFDTDKSRVEFCPAGEVRQGSEVRQEVIVLAARNEDVNDFLEQLHRSGAIVASLDAEPFALYRTVERFIRRREDENDVHVLVDVGARRSQVVIGRGREISFLKPIEIGSRHMLEAVSEKLGITFRRGPRPADVGSPRRARVSRATVGRRTIPCGRRCSMPAAASWKTWDARSRCACGISPSPSAASGRARPPGGWRGV
jgi:Tfp pilus assembly PilM family ATPase